MFDYDGVDDSGGYSSDFDKKMSILTDSSISTVQVVIEFNGVDDSSSKSVEKLSISRRMP